MVRCQVKKGPEDLPLPPVWQRAPALRREYRGWASGTDKKVLSRFLLLSGFRIKCGMTEFKLFDTLLLAAG